MADCSLHYRPGAMADELLLGECTIRPLRHADGALAGWGLWFNVTRDDGVEELFRVPVIPRGQFNENGPGGKSWGLNETRAGIWQISPSIHYTEERPSEDGQPQRIVDVWHKTPEIIGVPDGEPWQ